MRDKLIALLRQVQECGTNFVPAGHGDRVDKIENEKVADHLIANGVRVLTPDEARNIYTVKEIEEIQGEAYDLGVESVLHNHFGLSWHDAEAVRKEIAQLKAASGWIPVTERLPENDYGKHWKDRTRYNVLVNGVVATATFGYREHGWWCDYRGYVFDAEHYNEVTHWQPAPEPPKEAST